jgi:hypothetical protein
MEGIVERIGAFALDGLVFSMFPSPGGWGKQEVRDYVTKKGWKAGIVHQRSNNADITTGKAPGGSADTV